MKHIVTVEIDTEHLGCVKAFELAAAYASAVVGNKQNSKKKNKDLQAALGEEIIRRFLKYKLPFNTEIHKQYYLTIKNIKTLL